MESKTKEKGLQPCPYCKKEFKQLSIHAPSCKKRHENEAGSPSKKFGREGSYVDHHASGQKIPAKEERQGTDEANAKEKPRVICNGCGKSFIQLQKHKCTGIKSETTDNQSSPFPERSFESRPKSNQSTGSSLTSETGSDINGGSNKKDFRSPEDCSGSSAFISTSKPITEQSKGKGNEMCPDCGKSLKCLAKHTRFCKMKNEKRDAKDVIRGQTAQGGEQDFKFKEYEKKNLPSMGSLTKKCEAAEGLETKTGTKDGGNGSRKLQLQDSEPTPQRKHLESAPSKEQGKTLTSCPYCGKEYIHVKKHVRACKKNPSYLSGPTSIDETDIHSESSDQTQQKQNRSKLSGRKENFSEMRDSVELSSSGLDEEYAEGNHYHQYDPGNTDYIRPRETLYTPISMNSASLAYLTYSEDPKAELDRLQAGNEIDEVDISAAEKVVKEMEEHFLRKLNDNSNFKWTVFRTGSYSDKTKIKSANEFDFIVSLDIKCSAKCLEQPNTLGYCLVVPILERNVYKDISPLMKDRYLDPILVKTMAFKLFDQVIVDADFRQGRRIIRQYRDGGSPAYTITYSSGGGKEYDIDLVPAIHFDGWPHISAVKDWQPKWRQRHTLEELKKDYFAVARENPNAKKLDQGELLWRLSFSRTEKMLWLSADRNCSQPTCRKQILKILKGILEECKDRNAAVMPHLSSFHLRTFMLHQYDQRPDDNDWLQTRTCLQVCIRNLIEILSNKNMSNYYVRGHNILQKLEDNEIQIFIEALFKASATF